MILVTSANGNTGRSIVKQLVSAGLDVRATDINPEVENLKDELGVKEVVVGDLTNISTIRLAIEGASQIVFIPPLFKAEEYYIGKAMIDEAVRLKVSQFVLMSVTHSIMSTLLQHTAKRDIEEYLIYKGLSDGLNYTILQPMHYMHNFNPMLVKETKRYSIFYDIDTPLAYVDSDDVGEVTANVLKHPEIHNKATYELVGNDVLSPKGLVCEFNEVYGEQAIAEKIDIVDFMDSIHLENVYSRDAFIELSNTYSKYGIDGNANVLTWLLNRKPTSFKEYLKKRM
ncbi:uncharacterized protein YbjT (DUF2867 family) [Breznakia sp. PF5-3]|uniref:SDR family oxidoreductase n=1 Tax=unclassified Breznakia TaxID=2623764 RepID=UPI00240590CB|nr:MULTISPECIES: NmrA family NAD(P)-binding protein [unclassified Breznakia]MDF9824144.1 uncharacterized protein YbjT (DUF2867 family) [Breznakia sp. PM6-1]MDF9834942.1 uncharacterized protein YbjT (DUF2867 family) [Breznakia sp. PF5-3]MDF9837189.1 uncharacterized protein YbjT (DUF2867 family) [Breznakia sp. PFB2-8]MDF9859179.1 uncharacterized protein YbjT (DUF2867 family) [Breznakia sp. PH5-24]